MEPYAGMRPTGRVVTGPSSELVEVEAADGVYHTAIQLSDRHRGVDAFDRAIELGRSFMEFPMVAGLVELTHFLPEEGAFIYKTGHTRCVAELISAYREINKRVSRVAVLQLCYLVAGILQEASETGPLQGVFSHGDLSPWRITFKDTGDVQVIGYGIPCPDVWGMMRGDETPPRPGSLRYTPAERLTGAGEDVGSDLQSLALIAVELMTGKPLLEGSTDVVEAAVKAGDARRMVSKMKRQLGAPVVDLLGPALDFDPASRYEDAGAFAEAVAELLEGVAGGTGLDKVVAPAFERKSGRSLRSVAGKSAASSRAGSGAARSAKQGTKPTRGKRGGPKSQPEPQQKAESRWGRVQRSGAEEPAPEEKAPATGKAEARDAAREKRRQALKARLGRSDAGDAARSKAEAAEEPVEVEAPKRRGRSKAKAAEPEAPKRRGRAAKKSEAEAEEAPKRRRRTAKAAEAEEEEAPKRRRRRSKAAEPEAEEEEAPKRRRRSTKATSEEEEEAPKRRRRKS